MGNHRIHSYVGLEDFDPINRFIFLTIQHFIERNTNTFLQIQGHITWLKMFEILYSLRDMIGHHLVLTHLGILGILGI